MCALQPHNRDQLHAMSLREIPDGWLVALWGKRDGRSRLYFAELPTGCYTPDFRVLATAKHFH